MRLPVMEHADTASPRAIWRLLQEKQAAQFPGARGRFPNFAKRPPEPKESCWKLPTVENLDSVVPLATVRRTG